ncbi:hypothetical protein K439DRAFT_773095 [Ramaria rubella]|nr:hypothetical protein K439DRAFT_773095 [Ramaria rubella]
MADVLFSSALSTSSTTVEGFAMATRYFPNTVLVEGFPGGISRQDLLAVFGGRKGYINTLDFTNTPGEPKKAFIQYDDPQSLRLALEMNGRNVFNYHEGLVVRRVNEEVLCEHVPGEMHDIDEAFESLKKVLRSVLDFEASNHLSHINEINKLTQINSDATKRWTRLAGANRHLTARIKEIESTGQTLTLKLSETNEQLRISTDRRLQLQAENSSLEEKIKKATAEEQASALRLRHTSAQLRTITDRCSEPQLEHSVPEMRLKDTKAELNESLKHEIGILRRHLDETIAQKERILERLGLSNNTIIHLKQDLKLAEDARLETQSKLRWAKSTLEDSDSHVRALQEYATESQQKRQRAEDFLEDGRETKRRAVRQVENKEALHITSSSFTGGCDIRQLELEERLEEEIKGRLEAERLLADANTKLDQVTVTDSLVAAFLKMERYAMELVAEQRRSYIT